MIDSFVVARMPSIVFQLVPVTPTLWDRLVDPTLWGFCWAEMALKKEKDIVPIKRTPSC